MGTVNIDPLVQDLMVFLRESPTPLHAVEAMGRRLSAAGYGELLEAEPWQLRPQGKYWVRREGSLIALRLGEDMASLGIRLIGAHTDSPCLKVKPEPDRQCHGYWQLGVEVYGGVLLAPWFDRDLSLAGQVGYIDKEGKLGHALVDFARPIATVPSLAIHLNRDVNEQRTINKQLELPPILMQSVSRGEGSLRELLLEELRAKGHREASRVLEYDLSLYDTQPPAVVGVQGQFLASARLDNLLSCYVGLRALLDGSGAPTAVLVCNDHEEVGSASRTGAEGPFLKTVLERVTGGGEVMARALSRSLLVSTDNAHGIHPNYPGKHDPEHAPLLNAGPAIKMNANQRYASTGETASYFSWLCEKAEVPVQKFVARSDMGCGSTIGPITATALGVRAIDVGVPTFAMHSIRELAGVKDVVWLHRALSAFLR